MSLEASTWALEVEGTKEVPLDGTRKLVLLGYANHAHADGRLAFIGAARLSRYACCSERTAMRARDWLCEHGFMREADARSQAFARASVKDPRYAPVVYELAMSEEVRVRWAAEYAISARRAKAGEHGRLGRTVRGDTAAPLEEDVRGDSGSPQGVTDDLVRGDTAVSPEPSLEPSLEPPLQPARPQPADEPVDNRGGGGESEDDRLLAADQARLLLDPRLRGRTERQREALRVALSRALQSGPWDTPLALAEAVNGVLRPGPVAAPDRLLPSLLAEALEAHEPAVPRRRLDRSCERHGWGPRGIESPCPTCADEGAA